MFPDFGHFHQRIIEKRLKLFGPGLVVGRGAWGFERSVQPGVENFNGGVRGGGDAGDGENIGVVDGASIAGVGGAEAIGGEDAGELVGEDADAGAGSARDEAANLRGGGRVGNSATDLGGD